MSTEMEKGKRRKCAAMVLDKLREKTYFKQHIGSAPTLPIPAREKLPAVYLSLQPFTSTPETSYEKQNDFRFSIATILEERKDLDLAKCDAIDVVEEAIQELQIDTEFQEEFAQIEVGVIDPTILALAVYGFGPFDVLPPFGAVRIDCSVDMHYQGVMP